MNFYYYDFAENIIANIIKNKELNKSVLVFPNKSVKKHGIEIFQQNWNNIDILFITFQELEYLLKKTKKFPLKGIKRSLSLLACLNEEEEIFFKLANFKESEKFANSFFHFYEELLSENIFIEDVLKIFLFDWQKEIILKLESIKAKYKIYLEENNFFDDIFWQDIDITDDYFSNYKIIHFISHYYYTNQEKKIIKFLSRKKEINFHFQIPENLVDEVNFRIKDFNLKDLLKMKYSTQKISIFYSLNDFSMNYSLLNNYSNNDFLVSNNLSDNSNFPLICSGNEYFFSNSSIYLYLDFFEQLIEKSKKINSHSYFSLVFIYDNFKYIEASFKEDYAIVINETEKLLFYDNKFVCQKDFQEENILHSLLKNFENIINEIFKINKVDDLVNFLIETKKNVFLTEEEKEHSNVEEVFFNCLQKFSSFSADYQKFSLRKNTLWKIFLHYLKNQKYKIFSYSKLIINDYMEVQIQKKKSLLFVNVSKENFPSSNKPQFLLSEYQRKLLGLKTYEQVKMREKYYFYLAVLNAQKVSFYVVKNEDLAREEASYIQEIKFSNLNKIVYEENEEIESYKNLFSKMLNFDSSFKKNIINENFFTIPYEGELDKINLSYTDFKNLENPFFFFLNSKNINNEDYKSNFSKKFLGQLAHNYYEEIFSKGNYLNFSENSKLIFEKILSKNIHKLCFNFYDEYLKKYVYLALQESVLHLIKTIKTFLKENENLVVEKLKNLNLKENISIKGKVDLLITREEENLIIDFKTGNSLDRKQLSFYEYLFFLFENPGKKVSSFFYKIFEGKSEYNANNKIDFLKIIEEKIEEIKRKGFFLSSKLNFLEEISRLDLIEKKI